MSVIAFPERASWRTELVAASEPMQELTRLIERVAPHSASVLLAGETGSGKDVVARAIHAASGRTGLFVAINGAAVPTTLAESELFGHAKGAFTGAEEARPGVFREAEGGTLFLDEVAELDLTVQAKLLRVLETRLVRPVGASRSYAVSCRIIAATHRDLAAEVAAGRFREDLYFRITAVVLAVPSLRERRADIRPLVAALLREYARADQPVSVSPEALAWLEARTWPGNVRELRQALERAVIFGGAVLTPDDFRVGAPRPALPRALTPEPREPAPAKPGSICLEGRTFAELEREIFRLAIERHGGIRPAARALDLPPSSLADRLARYGIAPPNGRSSPRQTIA